MKKWSRYSLLIESEKHSCFFLFNTISNLLWKLDSENVKVLMDLRDHKITSNDLDENTRALLSDNMVITENDDTELAKFKLLKHYHRMDNSIMTLTIAPILECNLRCSYCFEQTHPVYLFKQTNQSRRFNQYATLKIVYSFDYGKKTSKSPFY